MAVGSDASPNQQQKVLPGAGPSGSDNSAGGLDSVLGVSSSIGIPGASMTDGLRRIALQPSQRRSTRAHVICIVGPAGCVVGRSLWFDVGLVGSY